MKALRLVGLVLFGLAAVARADLFSTYGFTGTTVPVPTSAYSVNGGLIHYFDNGTIYRQDSPGASTFSAVGHFGSGFSVNAFPAFLEFSPDGSRVAIGNSGGADFATYQVAVFDASALSGANPDLSAASSIYAVNHNAAVWVDNRQLLLTAGIFGQPGTVTELDTQSPVGSPVNPTVVGNIGGASAGVGLDAAGRLFTGNGFDGAGASDTGWIKAVSPAAWQTSPPADFENGPGSTFVADLLSAGTLHFDTEGNLLVGGGDFGSGDQNYFAIVSGAALGNLFAYGTPIDPNNPSQVLKFDPSAGAGSFYTLAVDRDGSCFYALDGGIAYQFCAIPEPSTWALLACGAILLAWRVRRHGTVALLLLLGATAARADNFFAEEVVSFSPGTGVTEGVGFGVTSRVLGGPLGGGTNQASTDVLTLGETGSVTLGFGGKWIEDGAGFDFIVFENPIVVGADPNIVYGELFFVEVSTDGANFARFDSLSLNPDPISAFGTMNKSLVSGLGGTEPGLANVESNSINPFDPAVAGGNAFDLASLAGHSLVTSGFVDLDQIRYVRLVDIKGDGLTLDGSGNPIYDPTGSDIFGNPMATDVESLAVIHGIPEPATITLFAVALMGTLLARKRK